MTAKGKRYWSCPCGTRNERIKQKCACGRSRPKKRVPAHAVALRDVSYDRYVELNGLIHAAGDECGVCGKPRSQERHHDRDHDHKTGQPRGLACGGNQGCNVLMLPWVTARTASGIWDAKRFAGESDAERWRLIAVYLERVEAFYASEEERLAA